MNHDLIEKKELSDSLLAIRYRDSKGFLDEISKDLKSDNSAYPLKTLIQILLLSYGSNHAFQGTGLFTDSYHRDAKLDDLPAIFANMPPLYIDFFFHINVNFDIGIFFPIPATHLSYEILSKLFNSKKIKNIDRYKISLIEKCNKKFHLLWVFLSCFSAIEETQELLGCFGLHPNRDDQFLITLSQYSHQEFSEKFSHLIINPKYEMPIRLTDTKETQIKEQVISLLKSKEFKSKESNLYFSILRKLILKIKMVDSCEKRDKQRELCFNRIHFLVVNALKALKNNEKALFLNLTEFIFDEIILLNALYPKYSPHDIKESIVNFFIRLHFPSPKISLGGSGMQVIGNAIFLACNEIKEHKKEHRIFFHNNLYYEIKNIVNTLFGTESILGKSYFLIFSYLSHINLIKRLKVRAKENRIMDVYVGAFYGSNFSIYYHPPLPTNSIDDTISTQLKLRSTPKYQQRRLIVIIDTTLGKINDINLKNLLRKYKTAIENGQLAIIAAKSLNKYFQIGFDKLSSGLLAMWYNPKFFPVLERYHQDENEWLGGFDSACPTIQNLADFFNYLSPQMRYYHRTLESNSNYVHKHLVPQDLKEFIGMPHGNTAWIASPHIPGTKALYCFLVILPSCQSSKDTALKIIMAVVDLLKRVGINSREGFGYAMSTYILIPTTNSIRISLGLESKACLTAKLQIILHFLSVLNKFANSVDEPTFRAQLNNLAIPFQRQAEIFTLFSRLGQKYLKIIQPIYDYSNEAPILRLS